MAEQNKTKKNSKSPLGQSSATPGQSHADQTALLAHAHDSSTSDAAASLPAAITRGFSALRQAARALRQLDAEKKNAALLRLASTVEASEALLLSANREDLERLDPSTAPAFRDRLTLNPKRLAGMVESLRQVAALPDPVGELVESRTLENGLLLKRVRAPLGVIFMIFESRPNVILEAFSLAFKSGNAIALRGGSESRATAAALYRLMRECLKNEGLNECSFYGVDDYDRAIVEKLLKRKDWIDVVVPRGGDRLIEFVQRTSLMPIIKNDRGLCHTYIDDEADLEMGVAIVANAKTQRPGVCNALETVLVNEKVAPEFLPRLYDATQATGLSWRCDDGALSLLEGRARVCRAHDIDWDTEYLDLIINCKVVKDLSEALAHIERHGSRHSEAIVTMNEKKARHFQSEIDAAAVYWNASTRFTDGFEFGLGGELGISTQKLHVRGPVGLRELTTPRWIIDGTGQVRG
jgi:glutamate-5-semialdehyde dehydrogenase